MLLTYEFAHGLSENISKTPQRHINNIKSLIFYNRGALKNKLKLFSY